MKIHKAMPVCAALSALALTFATVQSAPAAEQDCPKGDLPVSATIEGTMTTAGFLVGVRWGEGTLTMNDGSQHKFTAQGVKLIETGVSKIDFKGNVYNLENVEDFPGDYAAGGAGLTLGKGIAGGAILNNEDCVYINVGVESKGVRLSAPAPGGVLIKLEDW